MREVRCYSSAVDAMKGPAGFMTLPAFTNSRWTLAGDQRDETMRLFCRKLLSRLDKMGLPFYPQVGLMDQRTAQHRYVTGVDPWAPMANPYLDGCAVKFAHVFEQHLHPRCWALFAEIGFDVARLMQAQMLWGGFSDHNEPGLWMTYPGATPDGWRVDNRTYKMRNRGLIPYNEG